MSQQVRSDLVEIRVSGDLAIAVVMAVNLDDSNAEEIGRQLSQLVEDAGYLNLHLDLGNVQSIGSMGLATLVALHRKVKTAGGQLRLFNVAAMVFEVFQVTKLDTLLDIRRKGAA